MRTVSQAGEQTASGRTLSCDIVIVGGGTSGMVAAVVAAQRGKRVIVLEKNGYIGGDGLLSGCAANFGGGTDFQREAGVSGYGRRLLRGHARMGSEGRPCSPAGIL